MIIAFDPDADSQPRIKQRKESQSTGCLSVQDEQGEPHNINYCYHYRAYSNILLHTMDGNG